MEDEKNQGYDSGVEDGGGGGSVRWGIISVIFVVGIVVIFFIFLSISRWGGDSEVLDVKSETELDLEEISDYAANRQPGGEDAWSQSSDCESIEENKARINCMVLAALLVEDVSICESDLGETKLPSPIESDELIEISANDFCWIRMTYGLGENYCDNVVHLESKEVCLEHV